MRLIFFVGLVLIIALPSIFALDCSITSDESLCEDIIASGISEEEKEELYIALFYQEFPDYDYAYNHNTEIEWEESPEGVIEIDGTYIKNTWIILASVLPSVQIEDEIYHNGEGEILTGYNYDIVLPTGTASGDCKTSYGTKRTSRSHTITANGKEIGHSSLVSFTSEEDLEIETEMTITAEISIRHYTEQPKEKKYYIGGGKYRYEYDYDDMKCKYSHTEYEEERVTVSDNIEIIYYDSEQDFEINLEKESYSSYHGNLDIEDVTAFDLSFKDSSYEKREWYYSYNYEYAPYYTLQVIAEPYEVEQSENININSAYEFIVNSYEDCSITLYTHFSEESESCSLEYEDIGLSMSLSENTVLEGESFIVSITPSDESVIVSYGELEYEVEEEIELVAISTGLVIVSYDNEKVSELVFVPSGEWSSFFALGWFGMFIYILSNLGTFVWGKIGL